MNRIATRAETNRILKKYNFKIKRKYGQNFLIAPKIPEKIANCGFIDKETTVLEIGPGLGALTQFLLEKAKKVICFEVDEELIPILKEELKEYKNFELKHQDFMKVDLETLEIEEKTIIVTNLPYCLTSDILVKCLNINKKIDIIAMVQKEVAKRILSSSGGKDENELTLCSKYLATTQKIIEVSKNDFFPRPKVDSTVLFFEKKENINSSAFLEIIRVLYSQRRKTLFNNLEKIIEDQEERKNVLTNLNIDSNKRIGELKETELTELIKNLIRRRK